MTPLHLLALAALGVLAGLVNTIGGGGSLITLPALIFLGLPAAMANGTNRVGVLILARPKQWLEGRVGHPPAHLRFTGPLAFFAIGAYGGFLQAGVGIFLLAGLVLVHGRDLLHANAVKVLLVAGFTVPPLLLFVAYDLVHWVPGLGLAAGSSVGAWLATRMTVAWGARFIRWVLVAVVSVSATHLLGLW